LNALQETIHYSFINSAFTVFPSGTNYLCTTPWESKKYYQHGLDAGPLEFQFLRPRRCLTNPFRTLSLCFGVIGKTPGLISRSNFVENILSASAIAIMSWQDMTRSSLCAGVKECGTKVAHNFLFPKSSFRIRRTTVWGCSKILLLFLMRFYGHFLPNQQQQQCLPQFESILDGHLSHHLLPAPFLLEIQKNHLKTFDRFRASFS